MPASSTYFALMFRKARQEKTKVNPGQLKMANYRKRYSVTKEIGGVPLTNGPRS